MKKSRIFVLLFIFVLSVSSFCLAKSDLQNVSIVDGRISWNSYEGAAKYAVRIVNRGTITTSRTYVQLTEYAKSWGMDTGEYSIEVTGKDENDVNVSNTWNGSWSYVSDTPKLDKPTNLIWNDLKAQWDAVTNAEKYRVYLLKYNASTSSYTTIDSNYNEVTTNSYDFSGDARITVGNKYEFCVYACSSNNPMSDPAYSTPKEIIDPNMEQLATPTNVRWDGFVARWDAVTNAENYQVILYKYNASSNKYESIGSAALTSNTYYDFTGDERMTSENSYLFSVTANASSYLSSERGVSKVKYLNEQLATPTNLRWDNLIARWDAVENAESYLFYMYRDRTLLFTDDKLNTNYFDFTNHEALVKGHTYTFILRAMAANYPISEQSAQCDKFIADDSALSVQLSGDILSWNRCSYSFILSLNGYSIQMYDMTYDLSKLAQLAGLDSGTYNVSLSAVDTSEKWEGEYTYTSENPKLSAPTNPIWDGKIARWDAVSNAEGYIVLLFIDDNTTSENGISVANNYYDFTNDERIQDGHKYRFGVKASAENYPMSDMSSLSAFLSGNIVLGDLNVQVTNDGIITWDEYEGAAKYYYEIGEESGYMNDISPLDIKQYVKTEPTITVKLAAVNSNGDFITNVWEKSFTFYRKGDLDRNGKIEIADVRILLQGYTNYIKGTPLTESQKSMDMDNSGYLDVSDVRIILQLYVNQN